MISRRLLVALILAAGAALAATVRTSGSPAGSAVSGDVPASASATGEIFGGEPKAIAAGQRFTTHVLRNPGFVVGYSEWRRQPLWVAYHAASIKGRTLAPRPEHFSVDPRVLVRVTSQNYNHSGYDRGHLAPNFIIGKLYGADAQRATFLMSNVSPQRPRLNSLVWERLEEAEADEVAPAAHDLWVVTGPLFAQDPPRLRSGVAVPQAFYRIWLDAQPKPRVLAFVVPQDVCGTEPLSGYLDTVDDIEQRAGLDFFPQLDPALQASLEDRVAADGWNVARFDRKLPRYADRFGDLRC